jgi:PKD repeat protein
MKKWATSGIGGMILLLLFSFSTQQTWAQCAVDLQVNVNQGNCQAQVFLNAATSEPAQQWQYIVNGVQYSNTSTVLLALGPGTYQAYVLVVTQNNCTAIDDTIFTISGNPLDVVASDDLVACQQQAELSVAVSSSNPYSIQWEPAAWVSDPDNDTTLVTQNVNNEPFVVTVTDDVTGCSATDTVYVIQHNPIIATYDLCSGQALIDLGPGALQYQWLSFTDTAGTNHPLNYPPTQQAITVTQPGQYFAYAVFQECGALTSLITVEACSNTCFNAFTPMINFGQCSDTYQFVSTGTGLVTSWSWDFGDGSTSNISNPVHVFNYGTHTVTLTTTHSDGCTAVSTQTFTVTSGLSVTTTADTVACQGAAYMEAFPSGGSGNLSYAWTPTQGTFSDPTLPSFSVESVHEQLYYVYVTDNQTGCMAYDSVVVSSYVHHSETMYLCNDSVFIDLGPGAYWYNLQPLEWDQQAQSVWTDEPGVYTVYAVFPGCGAITSQITVEECPTTCVSTVSATLQYQNCGALVNLVGSYSSPIDSAIWNLGNGTTVVDYGTGIQPVFYPGGNYLVTLVAYHTGGCVSTYTYGIQLLTDMTAVLNVPDTVACSGQLMMGVNVTGGSGQYAYQWQPTGQFTNPTAQFPMMLVDEDEWVYVQVTDTYTGCTVYDSVFVYANQPINETVQVCIPGVPLEVDPGSMIYSWAFTPIGGTTTQLPDHTNSIAVTELGTYTCMTYYSGCQQVIHTFEVEQCPTVCSSVFTYLVQPQSCGAIVHLVAANVGAAPIDSIHWDLGNGISTTVTTLSLTTALTSGVYPIQMTAYHQGGCISNYASTITISSGLTLQLAQDTVACNGMLFANYTLNGGSGNYLYHWSPAALMSDPFAAYPTINVQYDTWVELLVEDQQSGCMATDSVYVYANTPMDQTLELCADSVLLAVNPGSMVTQWTYTDAQGNSSQIPTQSAQLWVDEVGSYVCMTYYSGCNVITHVFVVQPCDEPDDEVWPGDANSDGIVTNADALYLGLAFNQMGAARPAATLNWVGQPCPDWNFNFAQNNVNLKHADCNGDGIINFNDTLAIDLNYQNTHNKTEAPAAGGQPPIWLEVVQDTVALLEMVEVTVHLGTEDQPVDSLHGVAFSISFNEALFEQSGISLDFDNCILGTTGLDVLSFEKNLFSDGVIDIALTRNTLQNFGGYGPLLQFRIVSNDGVSVVTETDFGIQGITAVTSTGQEVLLSPIGGTVVIDPNRVGVDEEEMARLVVYPNPSSEMFTVAGLPQGATIELIDVLGQQVAFQWRAMADRVQVNVSDLRSGAYQLRVVTQNSVVTRSVRVVHQ